MEGKIKVIYGSVTPEELLQYTKEYDIIVDMRPSASEPLDRVLAKAKETKNKKSMKPRFKLNVW